MLPIPGWNRLWNGLRRLVVVAADLLVQQVTKVQIVNLKAAKALALNVPLPMLARADEVIE